MPKVKVYIANPLGFSDSGRYWLKNHLLPELRKLDIEILNPWEPVMGLTSKQLRESADTMGKEEAISLGKQNIKLIKEADAVFAVLDGTDVDSGTSAEIGYASALGKKVIGYRGDFRLSADSSSCAVNLQVQTFIETSGGSIHPSVEEALAELKKLTI
jgi:nucleoside 2-deoxyribosyltransferase